MSWAARAALVPVGAAVWGAVALRHGLPAAAPTWVGAVAAGWSLGLIPVHVAAAPVRGRRHPARAAAPGTAQEPPAAGPGEGPLWQRGHQ
jgi:hypothetical protein